MGWDSYPSSATARLPPPLTAPPGHMSLRSDKGFAKGAHPTRSLDTRPFGAIADPLLLRRRSAPRSTRRGPRGWVESSLSGDGVRWAEGPALGFSGVVDGAEPGEVEPGGRPVVGVFDLAVIELEVLAARTSLDRALATGDDHRGPQLGGDVSPEVRDGGDVFAVLDDRGRARAVPLTAPPGRMSSRSDKGFAKDAHPTRSYGHTSVRVHR